MKNLFQFLSAVLLITCLFSCKKDGASSSNSILGTWNFVSERVKEIDNNIVVQDTLYTDPEVDFKTIRFDNNNTAFVVDADNSSSTLTYTYDAQNKLLITDQSSFTVPTLTSSSLVLYSSEDDTNYKFEVTITCKR